MSGLKAWHEHLLAEGALKTPARSLVTWLVLTGFVVIVLAICGIVPFMAAETGVQFVDGALLFAPLPILAACDGLAQRRRHRGASTLLSIAGNFYVELYPALLIALSRSFGAALFAAFYLLTVLFHAQLFRVSARFPYWLACFLAQAAVSIAVNHDDAHVAIWSLVLPAALASALVAGNARLREDARRAEVASTRSALSAQLLHIEASRGQDLEERITELLGIAHDLKSPLSAALLDLSALDRALVDAGRDDLVAASRNIKESVQRLKEGFQATREKALELTVKLVPVDLLGVAHGVVARSVRMFPSVKLELAASSATTITVLAVVGDETVRRVLENVIVNACEGDGTRHAAAVVVRVAVVEHSGAVTVTVDDDGPGFNSDLLSGDVKSYATTKPHGTGLGLFTASRLVTASGGTLTRENRDDGGARVTLSLRLA